mgnify:FL=1
MDRLFSWGQRNLSKSSVSKLKMMVRKGYRNPCRISDIGHSSVKVLKQAGLVVVIGELCIIVKRSVLEKIVSEG